MQPSKGKHWKWTTAIFSPGIQTFHLGGFPIPAAEANDATQIAFTLSTSIDCSTGGSAPAGNDELYLLVKFGSATPDMTKGAWIKITPGDVYEIRKMKGLINIVESGGLLRPALTIGGQEVASGATPATDADYFPMAAVDVTNDTTYSDPENTATTINFFLVGNWVDGTFAVMSVSGVLELLYEELITGSLA